MRGSHRFQALIGLSERSGLRMCHFMAVTSHPATGSYGPAIGMSGIY